MVKNDKEMFLKTLEEDFLTETRSVLLFALKIHADDEWVLRISRSPGQYIERDELLLHYDKMPGWMKEIYKHSPLQSWLTVYNFLWGHSEFIDEPGLLFDEYGFVSFETELDKDAVSDPIGWIESRGSTEHDAGYCVFNRLIKPYDLIEHNGVKKTVYEITNHNRLMMRDFLSKDDIEKIIARSHNRHVLDYYINYISNVDMKDLLRKR